MPNAAVLRTPDLPYVPLSDNARKEVMDSVSKQGFTPLEHYKIYSVKENQAVTTNVLAFAHPVHRTPEYTGLTVYNAVNGYDDSSLISFLSPSASPFYLINRDNKFSLWACTIKNGQPSPIPIEKDISYGQLGNVFGNYEVDLQPQRIIDVKQGRDTFTIFRDVQPLQLSLWAADVTSNLLVSHFGSTVSALRNSLASRTNITEEERDKLATTLSIQLLGAIILADTGVLDDRVRLNRPSLIQLISIANKKFSRYFKLDLFHTYAFEANKAYQILQQICYASFLPDMLRELFIKAYSEAERKKSGSYDTPFHLTRQIWKNIPIEFLPPEDRIVADMTCGWGSFLVAGHERLSGLKDMQNKQLREYLYGNDSANFTAELAGLGLLLATSEDSWNIQCNDALDWPWLKNKQPNIIVGNPPFGGDRKKDSEELLSTTEANDVEEEKLRHERANRFLEYAIERLAPGGYLAMIMPRSFTVAEASPQLRKLLIEQCDIWELWELPPKAFAGPAQRTLVLFAQKKLEKNIYSSFPVRTRTIQPATWASFKSRGIFTASQFVSTQKKWNEDSKKSSGSKNNYLMDYNLVLSEQEWKAIQAHCISLTDHAEIMRGATVGRKKEKKRWADYPYPKVVPWLDSVKFAMPSRSPWHLDYGRRSTIIYPNALKEPCKSKNPLEDKEHILAGLKVLVPYASDPSWGRRIRVAIERAGHYVSDHFYIVTPKPMARELYINHEVIAAVLSWDVSNAWVIEHMRSPAIPKRAMVTIPFPSNLSEEDCRILTQSVHTLEKFAYSSKGAKDAIYARDAMLEIDNILKKAYHLDEAIFKRLRKIKEWDQTPYETLDTMNDIDKTYCLVSGIVDSIDASQGNITLWLKGFDELQTVPISASMPGWMLRPDVPFRTKMPYKCVKDGIIKNDHFAWGAFLPQPYAYMKEEEIFEGFASLLL